MTSEIRANTLKNRVGLGTVSYTNTGIIVSGIVTANSFSGPYNGTDIVGTGLTLTSTDAGSAAGPELKLFRNSASPADADYLGQIKFAAESDTGVERNYAKITGKILDASNGTEDGIIEFAHIKGGSQTITGRWRSDSLQLLNSTNFSVAGNAEVTGTTTLSDDLNVDSGTLFVDVSSNRIGINQASPSKALDVVGSAEISSALTVGGTLNASGTCTLGQTVSLNGTNPRLQFVDTNHNPDFSIYGNNGRLTIQDDTNSAERFRINSTGKVAFNYDVTASDPQYGQLEIFKNGASNVDNDWSYLSFHRVGQIGWQQGIDSNHFVIATTGGAAKNTLDAEKLRITSSGNVLVGGHPGQLSTYNSGQPRLSIYGSSGSGGYLELGGNLPHNTHSSGTILFINNNNSEATSNNANGKILAMQRVENVTSDTNAGDDMGGDLVFMTKPEAGSLTERLRIKGDGSTFLQTSNVNINRGTAGAGYPLTVRGPSDGDTIRIERANSYQWHIGQDTNGGNSNLYFKSNTTKEVVFPSTGGIAFNGEYAAANSLNDYEVGNWNSTVGWQNGNTTGSYNNSTTVQGTYVKVGNVVHAWIQVYPNSYNNGGDCVITHISLPFAVSTGGAVAMAAYSGQGNYGAWLSVGTYPRVYANLSTSATKITPLVTGNGQGAGFWGHKGGTVAANASFTATYYSA